MPRDIYIAVDGPASSGKSATFSRVAERLNFAFIDTGLFYRAFCWSAIQQNLPLEDEAALANALAEWHIRFDGAKVYVPKRGAPASAAANAAAAPVAALAAPPSEVECSEQLHTHDVDSKVSIVAKHPRIRSEMVECQRKIARANKPCIVLGRDITSVVLPDAPVKIYLDSSVKVRADRRFAQLRGSEKDYSQIYDALQARDQLDKNRPVGPLVRTEDSLYINNDDLTLDQAVDLAVKMIQPFLDEK